MASASGGRSPAKIPLKLPAAIANASLEELQKLCLDTLKKLRARDKRIEELSVAVATPKAPAPSAGDAAHLDALQQQASQRLASSLVQHPL